MSIRFGEFRKRIGLGEKGQDFHALRCTFTDIMEAEGVTVSTTGAATRWATTALYAKGERMEKELRNAINKVRYVHSGAIWRPAGICPRWRHPMAPGAALPWR